MTIDILFGDNVRNINDACFDQENGRCVNASLYGESDSLSYVRVRDEYILVNENSELPQEAKSRPATEEEGRKYGKYFGELMAYARSINAQFRLNVSSDGISVNCDAPNEPAKAYFENRRDEKHEKQFVSIGDSDGDNKPDKVIITGDGGKNMTLTGNYVTSLQPQLAALSKRISETRCK